MNCLFCSIINGEIPSSKVYENEYCYAFLDIEPQASVHCIIVPKVHIVSANEINRENSKYMAHLFEAIPEIAKALNLSNGYRIITNIGEDGCQSIKHLHFHMLGGEKLSDKIV